MATPQNIWSPKAASIDRIWWGGSLFEDVPRKNLEFSTY